MSWSFVKPKLSRRSGYQWRRRCEFSRHRFAYHDFVCDQDLVVCARKKRDARLAGGRNFSPKRFKNCPLQMRQSVTVFLHTLIYSIFSVRPAPQNKESFTEKFRVRIRTGKGSSSAFYLWLILSCAALPILPPIAGKPKKELNRLNSVSQRENSSAAISLFRQRNCHK